MLGLSSILIITPTKCKWIYKVLKKKADSILIFVMFRVLDEEQEDLSTISYLKMTKSEDAIGTYDDGLYINFGSSKP